MRTADKIATAIVIAIGAWVFCVIAVPKKIAEGSKKSTGGADTYRYRVIKTRGASGFEVEFWTNQRPRVWVSSLNDLVSKRTERWVGKSAILLEFETVYHDSIDSPSELCLLHDFSSGGIRTFGRAGVSPEVKGERVVTRTRQEFELAVRRAEER
jgi:hypothetical protein